MKETISEGEFTVLCDQFTSISFQHATKKKALSSEYLFIPSRSPHHAHFCQTEEEEPVMGVFV